MTFVPVKTFMHGVGFMHIQGNNNEGRRNACADFELNASECFEAYGVKNGNQICWAFIEDLHECKLGLYSNMRLKLMHIESLKKVAKGEMKLKDRRGTKPPMDSFIGGAFYP